MTRTLTAITLAAGLAFGAVGTTASAQTSALGTMEMGLSMLELSVQRELSRIGMSDVDVTELSLNQISQLQQVLSQTTDQQQRKAQAEQVLAGRSATIQ
jgi:hypothetical protein